MGITRKGFHLLKILGQWESKTRHILAGVYYETGTLLWIFWEVYNVRELCCAEALRESVLNLFISLMTSYPLVYEQDHFSICPGALIGKAISTTPTAWMVLLTQKPFPSLLSYFQHTPNPHSYINHTPKQPLQGLTRKPRYRKSNWKALYLGFGTAHLGQGRPRLLSLFNIYTQSLQKPLIHSVHA